MRGLTYKTHAGSLGLLPPMWNKRLVYGTVIQLAEMADSKSVKCGFEFHQCYHIKKEGE